ncbi:MAG: hypothetical protein LBQ67_00525 [Treponema sp.]|jgi:hypothetical protein|nr:hypothetical protein [Treponema sp.]
MAKIFSEDRHQYFDKIKPFKTAIESYLKKEQTVLALLNKDDPGAAVKKLALADGMISLTSYYIILSGVSQAMLKLKNEEALNEGRKSLYKAVIYLEEVVSRHLDAPFSDYEEKLAAIGSVGPRRRYLLVRRLGLAIQLLENAYGDNTKWRWSFVELEGRYTAAAKNLIDLKNAVANTDPRSPDYEPTMRHLRMVKKLLMQAADRYREKYELSTNRVDDFKMGINFLAALRRIHLLMGEKDGVETVKKKLDIWSEKLETDSKKHYERS